MVLTAGSTVLLAIFAYLSAPLWSYLIVGNPVLASPDGGTTVVLDINGEELARVATAVDFITLQGDVPVNVERVILGTEDRRFYEHNGVDPRGLLRALVSNVRGQPIQGGSTITQQLVRNETEVGTQRTLSRKVNEMLNAWRLEGAKDKDWILRRYLDTVWLGDGIRGVESAAYAWYRKPASDLTLGEVAMISATLPCPEACNPLSHPGVAETRRQEVLDRLSRANLLTGEELASARTPSPVFSAPARVTTGDRWVLDTVRRELQQRGFATFTDGSWPGGLTIHTTIDASTQQAATAAIYDTLGNPSSADADVEAASVALDPTSGGIRAIIGGRDFNLRQVNAALGDRGGGSGRQGGSTAKIFALVAALESGRDATTLLSAPSAVDVGGKPVRNYDARSWGRISLRTATTWSVNTAYVNLAVAIGPDKIRDVAERFGLDWPDSVDARAVIGVHDTDPLQMASVMATLANGGTRVEPHIVDRVERDGRSVLVHESSRRQVVTPRVAAAALSLLTKVVSEGTGTRAAVSVRDAAGVFMRVPVAGKTGTTNNNADAWFVGTTPDLSAAVWIGNPSGSVPLGDVAGYGTATGGRVPAIIFSAIMETALTGTTIGAFPTDGPPSASGNGARETATNVSPSPLPLNTPDPLPIPIAPEPTPAPTTTPEPPLPPDVTEPDDVTPSSDTKAEPAS
jgi:membrane peptidoglycan carboxypeptidase